MNTRNLAVAILLAAVPFGPALAQAFPAKPLKIIVPFTPGSATDTMARPIAEKLATAFGQQVLVENRPGAGGTIGIGALAKSPPDGYTLAVVSTGHVVNPVLYASLPYDTLKDFSGVAPLAGLPSVLVVSPLLGVRSVKDLVAMAKAKPGQLNYASSGIGSSQQFGAEMLKYMAGIDMVHVPYKGSGPAVTGMIAGEVQVMSASAASVTPHIKSGKLRALAVTSAKPSALLPGLPTVASAGNLPGYDLSSRTGVFASGKPPKAVIHRLNQEIVRAVNSPEIKAKFFASGVEINTDTPEESVATIKSEVARMAQIVKAAGMKAN